MTEWIDRWGNWLALLLSAGGGSLISEWRNRRLRDRIQTAEAMNSEAQAQVTLGGGWQQLFSAIQARQETLEAKVTALEVKNAALEERHAAIEEKCSTLTDERDECERKFVLLSSQHTFQAADLAAQSVLVEGLRNRIRVLEGDSA